MSANATKGRDWAWPVGICVGLGCVGVANAIMISIAISNPSAPAAEDHWSVSRTWDVQLEQRERSAALGWDVAAIERGPGPALTLALVDREGAALEGLSGRAALERADSAAHDAEVELAALDSGRYVAHFERAPTGLMWLSLELVDAQGQHFASRELVDFSAEAGTSR